MKETLINSTIEKPVTMNRLYQIVREELDASAKIAKENN
jgi:hypothetical protein